MYYIFLFSRPENSNTTNNAALLENFAKRDLLLWQHAGEVVCTVDSQQDKPGVWWVDLPPAVQTHQDCSGPLISIRRVLCVC